MRNWYLNMNLQCDGGSESWGVKLYVVQVWSSTLSKPRGLTTNWCCKSAHVNHTNLLLPAVLVAKMTNQPLCERETRKTQCRMEIWCCWDCRRLQAPHLSVPAGGMVLYAWGGKWSEPQVGFLRHPGGLETAFYTARKPGTLEDLTTQTSFF